MRCVLTVEWVLLCCTDAVVMVQASQWLSDRGEQDSVLFFCGWSGLLLRNCCHQQHKRVTFCLGVFCLFLSGTVVDAKTGRMTFRHRVSL